MLHVPNRDVVVCGQQALQGQLECFLACFTVKGGLPPFTVKQAVSEDGTYVWLAS